MLIKRYFPIILTGAALLLLILLIGERISAQPGTEADPVVSLTYLEKSLRTEAVYLEGGEEFPVPAGRGIILLNGSCRLSAMSGGTWWIVDITDGSVIREETDLLSGHYYLPVKVAGDETGFIIEALQTSTVAVPAGAGVE